jgi:malate dehydrogenase (oxaloacetate-decarboxylating)(NADP+)
MGIPIGKLALYCAAGGIAPHRVLPVALDVGTNNENLLKDPGYVGVKQHRLTGDDYFDFVDEFMQAVFGRWPNVVVQFEDFETSKAIPLLNKYRNKYRCFNDDIQGTGCVTLAGIISAVKITGQKITDMRFMCAGAGSAGLGVCSQLVDGLVSIGVPREEAMKKFVLCTVDGAIGRQDGTYNNPHRNATSEQKLWANDAVSDGTSLLNVVKEFKPTVILGLSTQANIFTEEMIRHMTTYCERPVILPMTNPTHKSECTPLQAYTWTNGKAIVATGSPFSAVTLPDGRKFYPSQCNNMYIYPGIGLATSVAGITTLTDRMFYLAAVACANSVTPEDIAAGRTFPPVTRIREVSHRVACAVIEEGIQAGLTTKITSKHIEEGISNLVHRKMYFPAYVPLM